MFSTYFTYLRSIIFDMLDHIAHVIESILSFTAQNLATEYNLAGIYHSDASIRRQFKWIVFAALHRKSIIASKYAKCKYILTEILIHLFAVRYRRPKNTR